MFVGVDRCVPSDFAEFVRDVIDAVLCDGLAWFSPADCPSFAEFPFLVVAFPSISPRVSLFKFGSDGEGLISMPLSTASVVRGRLDGGSVIL